MRIIGIVFMGVFTLLYIFQNRYQPFTYEPSPIQVIITVDTQEHTLTLAPYSTMVDVFVTLKLDVGAYQASVLPTQPLKDGDVIQLRSKQSEPCISLNNATQKQYETLPGIGPALAQRIFEYRTQHGSFSRLESVMQVQGIKERLFEKIKPFLCI